jgi:hypothetical protein
MVRARFAVDQLGPDAKCSFGDMAGGCCTWVSASSQLANQNRHQSNVVRGAFRPVQGLGSTGDAACGLATGRCYEESTAPLALQGLCQ